MQTQKSESERKWQKKQAALKEPLPKAQRTHRLQFDERTREYTPVPIQEYERP
jgi:hypothetical protein